ncbi:hypothetical protein [Pseudomonas sp. LB3P25]
MDVIKHSANVVGNILLVGVEGLSKGDHDFLMNCIYLASTGADSLYNSDTQPGQWIDYFTDIFWKYGWRPDNYADKPVVEYVQPQFSGNVQQAWLKVASPVLDQKKVVQVEKGLEKFESHASLLQRTFGASGKIFDLKISPVSYCENGDLELLNTHVRFIKSSLNTGYLFWMVTQKLTQLDIRARRVVISRRVMDARRNEVEKAVEALAAKLIDYEL